MSETSTATSGDGLDIYVWWTADCGALHMELNPVTVDVHCPLSDDGHWMEIA